MAKKKRKSSKRKHKHKPTARAKKAYYGLIVKSYKRLEGVVNRHAPEKLVHRA